MGSQSVILWNLLIALEPARLTTMLFLLFFLLSIPSFGEGKADAFLKDAQAKLAEGNYPLAIREARQAAAAFRAERDFRNLARALTRISLAQLYSGDYAASLATLEEALAAARDSHDQQSEAECWNSKGAVFYEQGRYSAAVDSYRESLRLAGTAGTAAWAGASRKIALANIAIIEETLGQYQQALDLYSQLLASPERMAPQQEAQLVANIGTLRRRLGDPYKALDAYREAQNLYRRDARLDAGIAVLTNIGIVQALDLHDLDRAAATFSEAKALADRSGNRPLSVQARLHRGEAYYRAGRLRESKEDFDSAASDARSLGKSDDLWKAEYGSARVAFATGQTAAGRNLIHQALSVIEGLRSRLDDIGMRPEFLADKRDVYDLAIEHSEDEKEIFRLLELSRGRMLRDRLHLGTPDLQATAARVPRNTALLEYWFKNDGLCGLLWISDGKWGWRRLSLGAEAGAALRALPSTLANAGNSKWRASAQVLARDLLPARIAWRGQGVSRLVVVPDGPLHAIPFEVLPFAGAGSLIENFEVSYLPSAGALQAEDVRWRIQWPWQSGMIAIADPEPNAKASGMVWARLPQARKEVLGIARDFHGESGVHMGLDARRTYVAQAGRAGVLHLATHAFVDTWNPARSFILFASSSPDQRYDPLYLKEVFDVPLQGVSLATLSACETSSGRLVAGNGVESFTQAFLASGARSVVASLWRVDDAATAALMLRFYGRLASGTPKGKALRQAKLDFLANATYAHPAYWAAFVLSGEAAGRLPYVVSWTELGLFVLAISCLLVAVSMKVRAARGSKPTNRPGSQPSEWVTSQRSK